jgi:nitroreductase/NAD-dependent dihydropyrimidine dehydrogenase PreA subunit
MGMRKLRVDASKCKRDGICVEECGRGVIELEEGASGPRIRAGMEARCNVCGHCVVVCPHDALSHSEMPMEDCPPIHEALFINPEQAVQFLRSRRSVRVFKDKPVEKDVVQQLIETARYAPTASNAQPVEWIVFRSEDPIHEMARRTVEWMRGMIKTDPDWKFAPYFQPVVDTWDSGHDSILRDAPVILIAKASSAAIFGMVDISIALSYLELAALPFGLGTTWAGLLQTALASSPPLRDFVGLSSDVPYHFPIMLGYSKFTYHRLPERWAPKVEWK